MILVTGATSQVGIVLVKKLMEDGCRVRCLVRSTSRLDELRQYNVELHYGDVEDKASLQSALAGVEYVVHIAGIWRVKELLEAGEEASTVKKLVFIGSTSRFKKLDSIDEKERLLAEEMVKAEELINNSRMNTIILRPTMLYGMDKDKNILQIIRFMNRFRCYPLIGQGKALKHPVYAGDVVNAILLCLRNTELVKKDYVIAGKEPIQYKDMLKAIKGQLGKRIFLIPIPAAAGYAAVFLYRVLRPHTYINYAMIKRINEDMVYDILAAVRDFGYHPVSFETGVQKQVQYLREEKKL
jgi:nucleoside-diphosphate-sugar epimerase